MEIWSNAHKWYLDESSLGPGSAVGEKGTGSNRKNIGERSEPSRASRFASLADFFSSAGQCGAWSQAKIKTLGKLKMA